MQAFLLRRLIVSLLFTPISMLSLAQPQPLITDYRISFGYQRHNGHQWLIIRRFQLNNRAYCLLLDSQTLTTDVAPEAFSRVPNPATLAELLRPLASSPYSRALTEAEDNALPLQDAGVTHALPSEKGIVLTIDLCPSHKPLDRVIFTTLMQELAKIESPVPLALSITGVWMREHPDDLAWLKERIRQGVLSVTWINHSFNHRVSPSLPLRENFLLEPGTDIMGEVLRTEIALIAQGLTPSVFFRFPGLISDQALVERITSFGLIPVGSDAWLAKGQQPGRGSIVLIHGNGNEPVGVQDFLTLLRNHQTDIRQQNWLLYDLREQFR